MLLNNLQIESILNFWFPNNNFNKFWFDKSVDEKIYNEYYKLLLEIDDKITTSNDATLKELEYEELLALIILLDQFSRNINRVVHINVSNFTDHAKKLSMLCINKNILNKKMNHICFILMPLRHLNKVNDYYLIINILNKIEDNNNEIYNKFRNETMKKLELLKN
jgi:uncharacterized protein (DUF924 family)